MYSRRPRKSLVRWNFDAETEVEFSQPAGKAAVYDDETDAVYIFPVLECTGSPRKRHLKSFPFQIPV